MCIYVHIYYTLCREYVEFHYPMQFSITRLPGVAGGFMSTVHWGKTFGFERFVAVLRLCPRRKGGTIARRLTICIERRATTEVYPGGQTSAGSTTNSGTTQGLLTELNVEEDPRVTRSIALRVTR